MGTYCDETDIEGIVQMDITASTDPNTTEVATWITEVEADADARGLGSYTLTDQKIDVTPKVDIPAKDTIAWLQAISGGSYDELVSNVVIPPFLPIVSIASLSKRTSALTAAEAWTALTEGPAANSSFVILKKRTKSNQYLGFALYFYANNPTPGYSRIKMTYNYGWNLSTDIIGEWCTLKVALKVLQAAIGATTPWGSASYAVGDMTINLDDLKRRRGLSIARIEEIERLYFPKVKRGIALI